MRLFSYIFFSLISLHSFAQISEHIHVDQFGYLPTSNKVAVLSDPQSGYNSTLSYTPGSSIELRNYLTDAVVFSAEATMWNNGETHGQSGDKGWWFDFSSVSEEGSFYVYDVDNDASSAPFTINANPYKQVLDLATKMFYYNRCNDEKKTEYVPTGFADGMNFMNPLQDSECRYVYDQDNADLEKDLSGGWFDAGDNNKYVSFAHDVIHNLIGAYEDNPSAFDDQSNIPESGDGLADILNELQWELDWLMKMSSTDGTAHIKMGNITYDDNASSPPSANSDLRYYGPECTTASIAIASMMARAAIVFEDETDQQDYAMDLETRAVQCWDYFETKFNNDDLDYECDDGTIKAGDADWDYDKQYDAAVIASVYLYELTGDQKYDDFFIQYYQGSEQISAGYWGPYLMPLNEALLRYTTLPGADSEAISIITDSAFDALDNNYEDFYLFSDADLYRSNVPDYMYSWGSTQVKSNLANVIMLFHEHDVHPALNEDLLEKAREHVHFMHGLNPLGLVLLSNMYAYGGDRCVDEIYHFWFDNGTEWDNVKEDDYGPAPGFVTGGPNFYYSGDVTPPAGQPAQKAYAQFNDGFPESSWEITEPAIYYQAAYIRLLSYFTNDATISETTNISVNNNCVEVYPNPADQYFVVRGLMERYTLTIYDAIGNVHSTLEGLGSEAVIDLEDLPAGAFFLHVENEDHTEVCVQKMIKEE